MPGLAFPLASPLGSTAISVSTTADVWAQDTIQITFSLPIKADVNLRNPDNYKFTPLDGGQPVVPFALLIANGASSVTEVFVIVNSFTLGKEYQIDVMGLILASGVEATVDPSKFIGRQTKEDSIINSRPDMWDMDPLSQYPLRGILQAIGRQDDLIGGSRNDRIFPTPAQPVVMVTISPDFMIVPLLSTLQFTSAVSGSPSSAVFWEVNGIVGGNATVGTISTTGLYTAPSSLPSPTTVTIGARSQVDTTIVATAEVDVVTQIIGWEYTSFPAQVPQASGSTAERQQPDSFIGIKRILP